ncbi:hypothetical protein ACF06Q_08720 [Streptomyces leeuwenhoekii]|uniref:hypothetical protein n=1 Tax=Streptomyces leeuwenhoekii TaxID=1437453 RepID=UPI0036F87829
MSVHRDTCHTASRGPCQPWDDAERGKYFGYAPPVIDDFLRPELESGPLRQQPMYVQVRASKRSLGAGPVAVDAPRHRWLPRRAFHGRSGPRAVPVAREAWRRLEPLGPSRGDRSTHR